MINNYSVASWLIFAWWSIVDKSRAFCECWRGWVYLHPLSSYRTYSAKLLTIVLRLSVRGATCTDEYKRRSFNGEITVGHRIKQEIALTTYNLLVDAFSLGLSLFLYVFIRCMTLNSLSTNVWWSDTKIIARCSFPDIQRWIMRILCATILFSKIMSNSGCYTKKHQKADNFLWDASQVGSLSSTKTLPIVSRNTPTAAKSDSNTLYLI